ncbi:MAG: HD domain-containing protein, partial [candidate division Zixibacteria bacterium]|nr:HD domain-containing protein [candidate division Zixibacteria bacterium]
LRMLRAVQFAARFNLIIEPRTFAALRKHASLIKTVSAERIAEEFNKLLELAENPSDGFRLMQTSGLLKEVMPELDRCVGVDQPGGFHKYDVFEHTMHIIDECRPDLRLRLAALFHDITKPVHKRLVDKGATFYGHESSGARVARDVMKRLRYSNDLTADVMTLIERHMFTTDVTDKGMRRLIKRVGVSLIFDLLDLRRADVVAQGMGGTTEDVDQFEADIRAELDRKPPFVISDLEIDGNDLMKIFDLTPGPAIGRILDHLMDRVLDEPVRNSRPELELMAREFYQTETVDNKKHSDEGSNQ